MASATSDQYGLKLKLVPLLVTAGLGVGLPFLGAYLAILTSRVLGVGSPHGPALNWLYLQHAYQCVLALVAIFIVRRFVPADYGLHWPRDKTYIAPAIFWGVVAGVVMTLVDYAPEIWMHRAPHLDYPLTTGNVVGWLGFEGIYVGPTEEIPFRALLVTYLAATMPGRVRLFNFEMNWAGIVVAVIFALLHADNFNTRLWPLALGQQIYAFALGVAYAYWLEKSRSVVAPAIGHNVGDVTEYAILFAWVGLST
jgi:membrane protease YdiL (CAAX protease family)